MTPQPDIHIEFLVEEQSAEVALHNIVPQILGQDVSFKVHSHQGRLDLLSKLPARLRGYSHWLPANWLVAVLVDNDEGDCHELKAQLEEMAREAGFVTKSAVETGAQFQVLNRLAIEELEAWFFGDVPALCEAYPRVDENLGERAPYRDPDAIAGGTWEALERELQRVGYFLSGLRKIEAARTISEHMEPERNRSHSFQVFRSGLLAIVS